MYLTEQEAAAKACGVALTPRRPEPADSPERAGEFVAPNCLGARCMLWRAERRPYGLDKQDFLERGEEAARSELRPTGRGRCGLAGRAE